MKSEQVSEASGQCSKSRCGGQLGAWWACGWQASNQAAGQQESRWPEDTGREGSPRPLPGPGLRPQSSLPDRAGGGEDASVQEMSTWCHGVHVSSLELVLALLPHW